MDNIDKIPIKGKKTRVVNPRIVTADEHNDLIENFNTLIGEVAALQDESEALSSDVIDAIDSSNAPSAINPFATMDDVPDNTLTVDQLAAISNANEPTAENQFATIADIPGAPESVLSEDELAGITSASSPSALNPFATIEDLTLPSYAPNLPYTKLAILITQSSTDDPEVISLENTTEYLFTYSRTDVGVYTINSADSAFVVNKTVPNENPVLCIDVSNGDKITVVRTSASIITISTTDDEDTPKDGVLTSRYIEIVIYK